MIIKQVDIINYGKWHHVTIPLQKGLNILYGRNEAGKTTLLSFIKGVLFGYLQRRTSHKNYIPRNSKDYGGQLEVSVNGHDYIIKRMAGKNGGLMTVLSGHGDQLDNSVLRKILDPFDRNTFDALYYFGNVNLKLMGKLKQRDLIYRIQRIGLAHSNDWIDYRAALDKGSKEIYSPRGYKPVLNQKLKRYSRLLDQVNEAKQSYHTYQELLQQIQQLLKKRQFLSSELKVQSDRADQLNRDQNAWTRYQKLQSLRGIVNQPILSGFTDDDAQQLQALNGRLTQVQNRIKLVHQQIYEADSQRIDSGSVKYYQQHRPMISHLAERFNDVQDQLERLRLTKRSVTDVNNQLKRLAPKYIVNGKALKPLNQKDNVIIHHVLKKIQYNQSRFQSLTQRLMAMQQPSQSRITSTDGLIYGISILMLVLGIFMGLLISGMGLILGVAWFVYRNRGARQKRSVIDQVHSQAEACRKLAARLKHKIKRYQVQYHYPSDSAEHWLGMQDNLKRLVHLRNQAKKVNAQEERLTSRVSTYFKRWTFMNRELTLGSDPNDQLQQLKSHVDKMSRAVTINQQSKVQRQGYLKRLKIVQDHERSLHGRLTTFYQDRHVKDNDDFIVRQQQQNKLRQQKRQYSELSNQIGTSELAELKRYSSYDKLQKLSDDVNQKVSDLKTQLQRVSEQKAAAQTKLHQMVRNGSYDELQQRVANFRTEINGLVKRWLEESLASQWINATLNLATKGRVPKIEHQVQVNFKILTNGRYDSIVFNKTKIKVMRKDKQRFTLYELSKGTVQQLYLALVFAMAQVFSKDYPMPLLIDDGFTDFDVYRRKAAVELLKSIGKELQVIYCTSDENLIKQNKVKDLNQF